MKIKIFWLNKMSCWKKFTSKILMILEKMINRKIFHSCFWQQRDLTGPETYEKVKVETKKQIYAFSKNSKVRSSSENEALINKMNKILIENLNKKFPKKRNNSGYWRQKIKKERNEDFGWTTITKIPIDSSTEQEINFWRWEENVDWIKFVKSPDVDLKLSDFSETKTITMQSTPKCEKKNEK